MKIKKLGLVCLVLTVAMAVLGIGYSMWWSEVDVNGTVSTGSVKLEASSPSSMYAYKMNDDSLYVSAVPLTGGYIQLVGYVETVINPDGTVTITFSNLFPIGQDWCGDFWLANTGTVPVHLDLEGDYNNVGADPDFGVLTTDGDFIAINFGAVNAEGGLDNLENFQLDGGQCIHVEFCISVGEDTAQGQSGSFMLHIDGGQWNEFTGGPLGDVDGPWAS